MPSPVESRTSASSAGRNGATGRLESRKSRSRISCERSAMVNRNSLFFQLLMTPARPFLGAGGQEDLERRRRENHRSHVAAVGDEPRRLGEAALPLEQGRPHRRHRGHARGLGARPLGADGPGHVVAGRAGSAPPRPRPPRTRPSSPAATCRMARLRRPGPAPGGRPPAPPAGTARRCRAGGSRARPPPGGRSCPCRSRWDRRWR